MGCYIIPNKRTPEYKGNIAQNNGQNNVALKWQNYEEKSWENKTKSMWKLLIF